jgi:hypothetical protein
MTENARFGLVFAKTGFINSGTDPSSAEVMEPGKTGVSSELLPKLIDGLTRWLRTSPPCAQAVALLYGVLFSGQQLDQAGIMNINGAIFVAIVINLTFGNLFPVLTVFCQGKDDIQTRPPPNIVFRSWIKMSFSFHLTKFLSWISQNQGRIFFYNGKIHLILPLWILCYEAIEDAVIESCNEAFVRIA